MDSSWKNSTQGCQIVKDNFQHFIANLLDKQYNGTKCNNIIFINVLFFAPCAINRS